VHITCSGARKGWTVCGLLVPHTAARRVSGNVEALERDFMRSPNRCLNCERMRDAGTS